MKIAIITSIVGLQEAGLETPYPGNAFQSPGVVDYFAFVDRHHQCDVWTQLPLPQFSTIDSRYVNRRNAKLPKVLGSFLIPGYDVYMWHDHCCDLVVHPMIIVDYHLADRDFAVFKHPFRDCAYEELDVIGQISAEHDRNIWAMKDFLQANHHPRHAGLFEMTSFAYRNTPKVQTAMLTWWELICRYCSRDQVSFPFVVRKHNLTYNIMPGSGRAYATNNDLFPQVRNKDGQ